MKIDKKHIGLQIGATFTAISFLLTFTFFIPIISIIPGVVIESIAKKLVNNDPYSNVGKLTILILSLLIIITIVMSLISVKKTVTKNEEVSKGNIIGILFLQYFLIHPLGFYLYWGIALNFRGDGQLIFGAVMSFPFSSIPFVLIGIIIDLTINKYTLK